MSYTRLFLVRHGQVEGYERKRYNGQGNVALTAVGEAQARSIGAQLANEPLAGVYCSDLDRCRFGAERIAGFHDLPVTESPELREIDIGDWQGATWAELQQRYPDAWQARLRDIVNFEVPGGESLQQAADRVLRQLEVILQRHPGECIALVAHGGVNRIILLDALGAPLEKVFAIEQDYGCYNIIDYAQDGGRLVRLVNARPQQSA